MREKKNIMYRGLSAVSPNSPTDMSRILWQTIGRITKEIFGVKGLKTSPHFWKGKAYRLMNKPRIIVFVRILKQQIFDKKVQLKCVASFKTGTLCLTGCE